MKAKFTFLIAVITLFLTACNEPVSKTRIKTIYEIGKASFNGKEQIFKTITDTFYYTTDGKRDLSVKGITIKEERHGNVIESKAFDKSGKLTGVTTIFIDERGREDSVVTKENGQTIMAQKYFYNVNDNLIEYRQYNPGSPTMVEKYKVVDGNRVELRSNNIPSVDTGYRKNEETGEMEQVVTTYEGVFIHKEYYTDKLNFFRNEYRGYDRPDYESKNLEKGSVQLSPSGDTLEVYFFRYTFDTKGRVLTAAQISRSGTEYDSTAYTYY